MEIKWLDDITFMVGEESFQTVSNLDQMRELDSSHGYVFSKTKKMLDKYCSYLNGMDIKNIFELGIFRGGSVIFFNEYLKPKKMVAVEFKSSCVDLDSYIKKKSLHASLIPYYDTNQADKNALNHIVEKEFGDEWLDMVVDDASHLVDETRASFNTLFPKLRPGGVYVIEDWQWAHCQNKYVLKVFENKSPLTNVIFEIIMACGSATDIIDEIVMIDNVCFIRRGSGVIGANDFDIANSFYFRGEKQKKVDYFSVFEKQKLSLLGRLKKRLW